MHSLKRRRQIIKEINSEQLLINYDNTSSISVAIEREEQKRNNKTTRKFKIQQNITSTNNNNVINTMQSTSSLNGYQQIIPCPSNIEQIYCYNGGNCHILTSEYNFTKQLSSPFCRFVERFKRL
uniref:Uncharacterized protein n=1 Tax=Meloidogyne hapla TaxID=6305 RepID=A0A1I8BKY0_MELHA